MPRKGFAKVKFEELILNELNSLLRKEFADPRLTFVSITHVEVNDDSSQAKVFWDSFDAHTRGDAKAAINGVAGRIRTKLASRLQIKHVPELKFFYNSQYEDEFKITKLLAGTNSEEE
jgi:ribosome-binding factor A